MKVNKASGAQNVTNGKSDKKTNDIEYILKDIGGSFGRFQLYNYALFAIPICLSGIFSLTYVFTAMNLDYRCYIPECDNMEYYEYKTEWMQHVIPYAHNKPLKCQRYEKFPTAINLSKNSYKTDKLTAFDLEVCSEAAFDRSKIVKCNQDGLIYRNNDVTIVNEFDITCEENEWKLAMVGAYNNIARLLFMPLVGILSDKFGRRQILIVGLCLTSISGVIQSFSFNYPMFVVLEFLTASVASATYPAAFILGMEWAGTKHRVAVICLVALSYPIGQSLAGAFAFYAKHFRLFLRIAYIPDLLGAVLMFLATDSLRWLLIKGKQKKIDELLTSAAKINDINLSQSTRDIVARKCESVKISKENHDSNSPKNVESLKELFKRKSLVYRFAITAFCWIAGAYVNYGVSVTSVSLHGDKYISFMIVSLGGVPSGLFTYFMLKHMGRPKCISLSLLITGGSIISAKLLPSEYSTLALILFFTGKCFSLHSFTSIYIFTTELWPTPLRHSVMGLCSTVGRIGAIMAPLTPLLGSIMELLPYLSFGLMSLIAGLLVLLLPETLDQDLPDTLDEAESIGRHNQK